MRKFIRFLLFFAIPVVCNSQQIKLTGQVSIHNSKYNTGTIEYVKDAYVTAPLTKSSNTDNEGKFELDFVGIKAGTPIRVQVDKAGLEVVNEYDLKEVIISRITPLKVYLTPKGELVKAQTELYNISREALFTQKDALISRLKSTEATSKIAIEELEVRLGQQISNRFEAETLLNSRIEQLKNRLPEFAQNLASQNLDFASAKYIEAYEFFKNGYIQKAIEILDDTSLEETYRQGQKNIAEGKKLEAIGKDLYQTGMLKIEQTVNGYSLVAESNNLLFNYRKAGEAYDKIIQIYLKDSLDRFELAQWYEKAATNYFFAGKYQKTLEYQLKEMGIINSFLYLKDSLVANSYTNIAVTYRELGDYNSALEYQKKTIQLFEKEFGEEHINLALPYYAIAGTYSYLGKNEETIKFYEKALRIYLNNPGYDEDNLAVLYGNRAVHYVKTEEYEKALENRKKGLEILERIREPNDPLLISTYANLGATYSSMGNYEKAIEYELKSIVDFEKIYDPEHPVLLTSYNNVGTTYSNMGNYEKALEYQVKATLGREKILPPQHPSLFTSYRNLANTYYEISDYDASINYYLKALSIADKAYTNTNDEMLFEMYSNLSQMYKSKEDYSDALIYEQKIIQYMEFFFSANDLNLASSYENIADVHIYLRQFSEALYYKEKAVKILKKKLDKNDQYLRNAIQILHLLKEKVKKEKK